jgi:hypothetical protein
VISSCKRAGSRRASLFFRKCWPRSTETVPSPPSPAGLFFCPHASAFFSRAADTAVRRVPLADNRMRKPFYHISDAKTAGCSPSLLDKWPPVVIDMLPRPLAALTARNPYFCPLEGGTASKISIRATPCPSSSCSGAYTRCVRISTARLCTRRCTGTSANFRKWSESSS